MVREKRSIDGITRPKTTRSVTPQKRTIIRISPDSNKTKPSKAAKDEETITVKHKAATPNSEKQLMNEINDSVKQLKDIEQPINAPQTTQRRKRHQQAKRLRAAQRRKASKKRIIKRIVIIILLVILGAIGYLTVKIFSAGGKIFDGNPLSMVMAHKRLDEDSNGRTNILIFGTSGYKMSEDAWDGAMLTDSIMVVSIDQDNEDAYMVSLPRDLYVKNDCPVLEKTSGKLNEVFYCKYHDKKDEKAGAKALMQTASEITGLDIKYYVHADWSAVTQIVDAVGGVDVKIESDDPRGIYDSGTKVKYANGEVAHLNGEKALALARARNHNPQDYGLSRGNYDREQNQQKILAAIKKKMTSTSTFLNISTVNKLIDSLGNNLITNFQSDHVQTLIDYASGLKDSNIYHLPLVGRTDGGKDLVGSYEPNGSYLGEAPTAGVYDYSDIQAYIQKNIANAGVVKEKAKIDVLNGSSQSGLATDKADELKEEGYTIGKTDDAPSNISDKVIVYQLNKDKKKTAKALKKKYGSIKKESLSGYNTDADFIIVFGEGSVEENNATESSTSSTVDSLTNNGQQLLNNFSNNLDY